MATDELAHARLEAGLDALELDESHPPGRGARIWGATWPKLVAAGLFVFVWQVVVWSGWKDTFVLPGPAASFSRLWRDLIHGDLFDATWVTMRRAIGDFAVALVLGTLLGVAVARSRVLRSGIGSMVTGLQTMPSIAWFPLAILLFKLSETAILFVVVLGAAPSIANGLINGVDNVPPLLVRAGRSLGARGLELYRHVVLPASMPSFVAGLKQGWAFAWRSLMAGELIVIVAHRPSIGAKLQNARDLNDAQGLMALMIVVLVIGIVMDSVFTRIEGTIRARWGLIDNSTA